MELTILVDNYASRGQTCRGEHGASFYVEDGDIRLLLDMGQSDLLLENAEKLGIDLHGLTHVVLSHGHYDHAGGLRPLAERVGIAQAELIAHPDCFLTRRKGQKNMGAPYTAREIESLTRCRFTREPRRISDSLLFLGEIPRNNRFETTYTLGERCRDGVWEPDDLRDDSALVYQNGEGIFLITGCSHSGICNIVDYARQVCREERVLGILGGFHLQEEGPRLEETVAYLRDCQIPRLCPCHCVSLGAKARMMGELPVEEVGVGAKISVP